MPPDTHQEGSKRKGITPASLGSEKTLNLTPRIPFHLCNILRLEGSYGHMHRGDRGVPLPGSWEDYFVGQRLSGHRERPQCCTLETNRLPPCACREAPGLWNFCQARTEGTFLCNSTRNQRTATLFQNVIDDATGVP